MIKKLLKKIWCFLSKFFLKCECGPRIPYFYDDERIIEEQTVENGRKEREEFEIRSKK